MRNRIYILLFVLSAASAHAESVLPYAAPAVANRTVQEAYVTTQPYSYAPPAPQPVFVQQPVVAPVIAAPEPATKPIMMQLMDF